MYATINQVLDFSIIGLIGFATLFTASGLTVTAIACWKNATFNPDTTAEPEVKPEPVIPPVAEVKPPESTEYACPLTCASEAPESIEYACPLTCASEAPESTEYACPLTCELPQNVVTAKVVKVKQIEKVKLSRTAIAKLTKKQLVEILPKWELNPQNYKTADQMKKALRAV